MDILRDLLLAVHIGAVLFMSAPLFALIMVNERGLLGPTLVPAVDNYMESMIRRQAIRCYVFQGTALASGIALVLTTGMGISSLYTNGVLALKVVLLLSLGGLLSYVHLSLQPRIDSVLREAKEDAPSTHSEIWSRIRPLRLRRKKLGTFCLFLVLVLVILGLQVVGRFNPVLTVALVVLAASFSLKAYRSLVRFGWV